MARKNLSRARCVKYIVTKKIIEYFQDEPAALYYLVMAIALTVPVIVSVIVYVLRGAV
jgi:hypothetical protein